MTTPNHEQKIKDLEEKIRINKETVKTFEESIKTLLKEIEELETEKKTLEDEKNTTENFQKDKDSKITTALNNADKEADELTAQIETIKNLLINRK